jgi:hypothetical protein
MKVLPVGSIATGVSWVQINTTAGEMRIGPRSRGADRILFFPTDPLIQGAFKQDLPKGVDVGFERKDFRIG